MDYDAFEVRIAERKRRAEEASNIVRNVRRRVAYDVEEEEEEEEDNMQEVELDVGPLLHRIDAVALNCSTSKSAGTSYDSFSYMGSSIKCSVSSFPESIGAV